MIGGVRIKIGLIDVDGHNFPNLALMRISSYHKSVGDDVEWYYPLSLKYDIVYASKIFSDQYTQDVQFEVNSSRIVYGGTGYAIKLVGDREVYDFNSDVKLPEEIEHSFPDYSIYPQFDFAVSMTSRGCPRGCSFCHVSKKEGRQSIKVANVSDFYSGQKSVRVLDPNITACKDKRDLFAQYAEIGKPRTGAEIDFTQGIDIRLIDQWDIQDLNAMRLRMIHFAWDNAHEDLYDRFKDFASGFRRKCPGMVYCLVNFDSTMEENLHRIYSLRDLGHKPYVMIYNKPSAPKEIRMLQRWCNNKIIFNSCRKFEDYTA